MKIRLKSSSSPSDREEQPSRSEELEEKKKDSESIL